MSKVLIVLWKLQERDPEVLKQRYLICLNVSFPCLSFLLFLRHPFFFSASFSIFFCCCQQAGGAIVMEADATSALHKRGIVPTDDSFKYAWFKVIFFGIFSWRQFNCEGHQGDKISFFNIKMKFHLRIRDILSKGCSSLSHFEPNLKLELDMVNY